MLVTGGVGRRRPRRGRGMGSAAGGGVPRRGRFPEHADVHPDESGDVLDAAISPDGRYVAYAGGDRGEGEPHASVRSATGSDVEVVPAGDAALDFPAFSPDGNYLFSPRPRPDTAVLSDALSGPVARGHAARARIRRRLARQSSPDGKQIAFWRGVPQKRKARLLAFDLEAGRERDVTTVAEPEVYQGAAAWSPDGEKIAVLLLKPAPDLETTFAFFDAQFWCAAGLPQAAADDPHEPGLAAGRPRPGRGQELRTGINDQVFLISHPEARLQRVTNDFNRWRLGLGGRGGHRRGAPDAPRQPLGRRRLRGSGPADHLDREPGGLPLRARGDHVGEHPLREAARPVPAGLGDRRRGRRSPSAHCRKRALGGSGGRRRRRRLRSTGRAAASTSGACRRTGATPGS